MYTYKLTLIWLLFDCPLSVHVARCSLFRLAAIANSDSFSFFRFVQNNRQSLSLMMILIDFSEWRPAGQGAALGVVSGIHLNASQR